MRQNPSNLSKGSGERGGVLPAPPVLPLWVSSPPADKWGAEEVAAWLETLGLGEYRDIFIRHDIQGSELILLERRDLKVPLLSPHPAPGSIPRAPHLLFFFFPPPGPGHHQSRPHEEDPAGHQGAQQPALGWWQHRGGHLGPRCLLCVCVCGAPPLALLCLFVPQRPWSHCFSPSPRGWRAPERSFGPCQQPGWRGHYRSQGAGLQCGAKSRDFSPSPKKIPFPPMGI